MEPVKLSVRTLVEFVLRCGDIDARAAAGGYDRANEGARIHRKLQKAAGKGYQAEVSFKATRVVDGIEYRLEGRADGIIETPDGYVVDEIKTTSAPAERLTEDYNPLHWAQAKCYAAFLCKEKKLPGVTVQLTYYQVDTEETVRHRRLYGALELENFLTRTLHLYTPWAKMAAEWREKRTESLKALRFPFAEYRAGQFIRLQRHDDFWRGKPLMPQVVVDLGSGGTGRLSKLLTGECDVLAWPAASQLSILRDDPRLRLTLRPGMNVAYLAFNTAKPPLNNPAVRHALALAINNQRLMQSIYYGTAETAASILPRASWAYDNEAKITEYNPAKSREQLKSLGLENLTLKLWVPTRSQAWNPSPLKTAELIQADMAQVGVKVVIVPVEGRFQEARLMDMSHDLTLSGWATDSNDPDSFFRPLLSCAAIHSQTNLAHWCDPKFDSVLRKALSSQQLAARIEAYDEAQSILAQELPILPLASSLRLQAYRYDIKGLVLSPFGNASFAGVYREKQDEVKKP